MICIVSFHSSVVVTYWAWSVLFHFMPHWFIINGHGLHCLASPTDSFFLGMVCILSLPSLIHHLYCFTACFSGSYFLGMICTASFHASLVLPDWPWLVLFHCPHQFIITVHGLFCFTSCVTGSSLLGMVCIVSLHALLVYHYWAWYVLLHVMLQLFLPTGYGQSCFTDSSLQGMVCIV